MDGEKQRAVEENQINVEESNDGNKELKGEKKRAVTEVKRKM